jgi:hypothetical protein
MTSHGISSPDSWPRMPSDVENPFQNAPGPFIYALPNLAGPGPFLPSAMIADCSLDCPGPARPPDDHHDHRHDQSYHNPATTAQNSPEVESARPPTEDSDQEVYFTPESSLITLDEKNDDDDTSDSDDTGSSQKQEQSCSGSSTPTPSQASSSPTSFEFSEEKEDNGSESNLKEKEKRKRKSGKGARRRRRNRRRSEQGGCVMGPRVMGIPGIHLQQWFQHSLPQRPPSMPLPAAMPGFMGHAAHPWYPTTGYYGYPVNNGNPTWLLPAAPVPGLFRLPAS